MIDCLAYKIDIDNEIVFHSYSGDIKIIDIKNLLIELSSKTGYSKSFDQVFDFRFCNLCISIDELPEFANFFKNEIKDDVNRKYIYLTNKPHEVALTIIFGQLIENLQIKPQVVSTLERTIRTLSKPNLDINKLENILNELNHNFINSVHPKI